MLVTSLNSEIALYYALNIEYSILSLLYSLLYVQEYSSSCMHFRSLDNDWDRDLT